MNHYKKALEEGENGFEEKFVFIPPPEKHESGGTLLRPYEITGSVGDVKRFIHQFAEKIRQAVAEDLRKRLLPKSWDVSNVHAKLLSEIDQALTEFITHKREQLTKEL